MKIQFIKIAEYDPLDIDIDRFVAYQKITTQEVDPSVRLPMSYQGAFVQGEFEKVFCSHLLRGQESAKYLAKEIVVLEELAEVNFSLEELVSREEFLLDGSALVRLRFVEAFLSDTLRESRRQLKARIDNLFVKLKVEDTRSRVVCVSHSFLMKIIEAYVDFPNLFERPQLLSKYIKSSIKTYDFGGGFEIDVTI